MAQWDEIGIQERWGEYYAGRRADPPKTRLDANGERSAWEWAAAIIKVDNDRAARFAAYLEQNGIGRLVR